MSRDSFLMSGDAFFSDMAMRLTDGLLSIPVIFTDDSGLPFMPAIISSSGFDDGNGLSVPVIAIGILFIVPSVLSIVNVLSLTVKFITGLTTFHERTLNSLLLSEPVITGSDILPLTLNDSVIFPERL